MSEAIGRRNLLREWTIIAMLSSLLTGIHAISGSQASGFDVHPNLGRERHGRASRGKSPKNQPTWRLNARRRNQHPAHPRRLDMDKRFARAGSGAR